MPSDTDLRIDDLDPTSPEDLRAFWEVEQAAQRADRDDPVLRGYDALALQATQPSAYKDVILILARDNGSPVGTAELSLPTRDNTHMGTLEINVLPSARRRGIGRALHSEVLRRARAAGRSRLYGEVYARDESGSAATDFARAVGGSPAHREDHLTLGLPLPEQALEALGETDPAYDIVTWEGACPDDLRADYIAMRNRMMQDVPMGEISVEPVVFDEERLRSSEERTSISFIPLVAAARERQTGRLTAYSLVFLPHDNDREAWQDDTLVMPEHRGHHIGLALKRANFEALAERHPTRRRIHTWMAPDNIAMRRTNERVGFDRVEVMHEMEFRLD